jgi:predicted XRE-type DNA-binding protein
MEKKRDYSTEGEASYREWRDTLWADPEYQRIYEGEAAKSELWLQLVEARQAAGLTQKQVAERMGVSQAQVARIEKAGYDAYTLRTLRRYIEALGDEFSLQVTVQKGEKALATHVAEEV